MKFHLCREADAVVLIKSQTYESHRRMITLNKLLYSRMQTVFIHCERNALMSCQCSMMEPRRLSRPCFHPSNRTANKEFILLYYFFGDSAFTYHS